MSQFFNKPVNFLAKYTFGIYLIHMYFVDMLPKFIVYWGINDAGVVNSPLYRLAAVLIIISVCILIIFILRKIPAIRHIVP